MNQRFLKQLTGILSLSAFTVYLAGLPAQAETTAVGEPTQAIEIQQGDLTFSNSDTISASDWQVNSSQVTLSEQDASSVTVVPSETSTAVKPAPGTAETSAEALLQSPEATPQAVSDTPTETDSSVAQIFPGSTPTVSRSYIGGGVITDFDDFELAIKGKLGLTSNLSLRPTVIFGDVVGIMVPVTYDFNIIQNASLGSIPILPYAGAGALFFAEDVIGDEIGFLLTGGADVPISQQLTANASVDVSFLNDDTEFSVFFGVGYNFPGFGF